MTRREMLLEQYEDALFALLMDEVAEAEGRKAIAENERLKELGEPMISEFTRQRCMRIIARKSTQQDVKRYGHMASRVITKVAVVALVAMLLFTTVFASSETFRVKTLNFVIDAFDDRTELSLVQGDMAVSHPTVPQITVGWMPEEFELTDEGYTDYSAWCQYEASADERVTVLLTELTLGGVNFDTETAEMVAVTLQNTEAYIVEDLGVTQILWRLTENSDWLCMVTGRSVDVETLLKIAENVAVE